MSRFEKRGHFAVKIDFELVALEQSTVNNLSVAFPCASIAASTPKIRLLEIRKYVQCDCEKTANEDLHPLCQLFCILSVLQKENGGLGLKLCLVHICRHHC